MATANDKDIMKHTKFVRHIASRMSNGRPQLLDDLFQEGMISLIRSAKSWKEDKGADLLTWAKPSIIRDMWRYVKKQTKLNLSVWEHDDHWEEPSQENEASLRELARLVSDLPKTQRFVLLNKLKGESSQSIQSSLGLSRQETQVALDKATAKLREQW